MAQKQFLGNKASFGGYQYKWKPERGLTKKAKREKEKFCTARPFTQGIDNIVQYVFKNNGPDNHIAYVECDYVK
jgi:hypothetical protein